VAQLAYAQLQWAKSQKQSDEASTGTVWQSRAPIQNPILNQKCTIIDPGKIIHN